MTPCRNKYFFWRFLYSLCHPIIISPFFMFVILCVAVHSAKHRLPWGMIPFPVTMTWAYFLMSFRCGFHVDQYGFGPSLTTLYTMVGNLYSTDHRAADDQSGKSFCEPKSNKVPSEVKNRQKFKLSQFWSVQKCQKTRCPLKNNGTSFSDNSWSEPYWAS